MNWHVWQLQYSLNYYNIFKLYVILCLDGSLHFMDVWSNDLELLITSWMLQIMYNMFTKQFDEDAWLKNKKRVICHFCTNLSSSSFSCSYNWWYANSFLLRFVFFMCLFFVLHPFLRKKINPNLRLNQVWIGLGTTYVRFWFFFFLFFFLFLSEKDA